MVEKVVSIIMWIIILVLIVGIMSLLVSYIGDQKEALEETNAPNEAVMRAVVMQVYKNSLGVMEIKNNEEAGTLYTVSFAEEGDIGFKPKQEINIYYDGTIAETYPAQIHHVNKIEILKDTTEISIPDDIIRYYNNSKDKVNIQISEASTKGFIITIEDENELPYVYTNDYILYQEVKNENYTGKGEKIGEDTENSTSGYTGTGAEYIWKELDKNANIKVEQTIEDLVYNLPNQTENNHMTITGKKINWEQLYGELGDGKYKLVLSHSGTHPIIIQFTINNANIQVISQELSGI